MYYRLNFRDTHKYDNKILIFLMCMHFNITKIFSNDERKHEGKRQSLFFSQYFRRGKKSYVI